MLQGHPDLSRFCAFSLRIEQEDVLNFDAMVMELTLDLIDGRGFT